MQPSHSTDRSLSRRGAAVVFASAVIINLILAGLAMGWRVPGPAPAPDLTPSAWARDPAPSVTDLRGRVILVAFFRSSDRGTGGLLSRLTAWDRRYGRVGLQVIGVCLGDMGLEDERRAIAALLGPDPPFPVAIDAELACARQYGIRTSPVLVAIDRNGCIRRVFEKARRWDDVDRVLWALLAEPGR